MMQENLVNINLASREALIAVPGIGPALADRIIERRPFESLEGLADVRGISLNTLEDLRPYLTLQETAYSAAAEEAAQTPEQEEVLEAQVMELNELDEAVALADAAPPAADEPSPEPREEKPVEEPVEELAAEPAAPFEVKVEQPVEKQSPPPAAPTAKPAQEAAPRPASVKGEPVSRNEMLLYGAGFAVISVFLAVILALGILAVVNASLNYPTEAQFIGMQRDFEELSSQTTALQQDVASLRTRMDNLEALSGRVSDLETQSAEMQAALAETDQQVDLIAEQVGQLDERTGKLEKDVLTFNRFLDGLRSLLSELVLEPVSQ